jgi:hypothetical protein
MDEEDSILSAIDANNKRFKNLLLCKHSQYKWTLIPAFVFDSEVIDSYEKMVYAVILDHVHKTGTGMCCPSKETIAKRCGISKDKVRRALLKLKSEFFIDWKLDGWTKRFEFFTPEVRESKILERKKNAELAEKDVLNKIRKSQSSPKNEQNRVL